MTVGVRPVTNPTEPRLRDESPRSERDSGEINSGRLGETANGRTRRVVWQRALAFLPGLAMLLAIGAGFLKWQDSAMRGADVDAVQAVQAASASTVALLSYQPDTVDQDLGDARSRLTGAFLDSYTALTNDVVIPGAKQKRISAVATVPAAASISVNGSQAVVMVFVNQRNIVGGDAPSETASTVKITLNKISGRWLISEFEPI